MKWRKYCLVLQDLMKPKRPAIHNQLKYDVLSIYWRRSPRNYGKQDRVLRAQCGRSEAGRQCHREGGVGPGSWRTLVGEDTGRGDTGPKAEWSESTCEEWEGRQSHLRWEPGTGGQSHRCPWKLGSGQWRGFTHPARDQAVPCVCYGELEVGKHRVVDQVCLLGTQAPELIITVTPATLSQLLGPWLCPHSPSLPPSFPPSWYNANFWASPQHRSQNIDLGLPVCILSYLPTSIYWSID